MAFLAAESWNGGIFNVGFGADFGLDFI